MYLTTYLYSYISVGTKILNKQMYYCLKTKRMYLIIEGVYKNEFRSRYLT